VSALSSLLRTPVGGCFHLVVLGKEEEGVDVEAPGVTVVAVVDVDV